VIGGLFGTHWVFSEALGGLYDIFMFSFEILAFLVLMGCVVFMIRRNVLKVKRLYLSELNNWPKTDANLILTAEILLMAAFLTMNAADLKLQVLGVEGYHAVGSFPISSYLLGILPDSPSVLIGIERFCW